MRRPIRANAMITTGVFLLFAAVLSLSSGVTPIWKATLGVTADWGRAIESLVPIDLIDRQDIPFQADEIGHLLLWGGGMLALGLRRRSLTPDVIAVSLFATSVGFELLQATLTSTRSMQVKDIAANGFGIVLGLCAVVLIDTASARRATADLDAG